MIRSIHRSNIFVTSRVLRSVAFDSQSFRITPYLFSMPPKRKRSTAAAAATHAAPAAVENPGIGRSQMRRSAVPLPTNATKKEIQLPRRQSARGGDTATTNPDVNPEVLDGISALRASPDESVNGAPNGVSAVSAADPIITAATTENKVCSSAVKASIDALKPFAC
jgi:hypothetical protein